MEQINLPPFYVGQKVVAIENSGTGRFKKGDKFIVNGNKFLWESVWCIDIGHKNPVAPKMQYRGRTISTGDDIWWTLSSMFAPIEENFQSISLEKILEEETKLISVN